MAGAGDPDLVRAGNLPTEDSGDGYGVDCELPDSWVKAVGSASRRVRNTVISD